MDVYAVRACVMWWTIIDAALLTLSFLICACAGDWVYRMHSRWFPISRQAFDVAIYSFLGLFKILFIVFNVVPYVALLIATS